MRKIRPHITYANLMVTLLAFIVVGGGSAWAASELGKNSVGSRQLKSKSVTTGKIGLNAVNSSRVADGSLTGADINISKLGTVPSAVSAASANNANSVDGHAATCPASTTLIRGTCFDPSANPAVGSVEEAADKCAAKGGYLPTPMQLYAVRGILNLGSGVGTDKQFTDSYYYDATNGSNPSTVTIDGTGVIAQQAANSPAHYFCAYSLLR